MRSLSRSAVALIGLGFIPLLTAPATAQQNGGFQFPVSFYNSQSVQYGLNLPQVPIPNGADEIRAADGTTCRSNIASNGPTLDVGMLGNQDFYGSFSSGTIYGRVVVPLGDRPKRIDCTALYKLEIERLQHELRLVQMGLNGKGAQGVQESSAGADWQTKGWSNGGPAKAGASAAPQPPATARKTKAAPATIQKAAPVAVAAIAQNYAPQPDLAGSQANTRGKISSWEMSSGLTRQVDMRSPPAPTYKPEKSDWMSDVWTETAR